MVDVFSTLFLKFTFKTHWGRLILLRNGGEPARKEKQLFLDFALPALPSVFIRGESSRNGAYASLSNVSIAVVASSPSSFSPFSPLYF